MHCSGLAAEQRVGFVPDAFQDVVPYPLTLIATLGVHAQTAAKPAPVDESGRANSPFSRNEGDLPKGPAPWLGPHPDLSGYWVPSHAPADKPVGNLGKDYPGYKLPFTPAGEKAHQFNVEHTVDPEALCIVGGLPRHNSSGLPFQLVQGQDHAVFLYWYTTYRLVPFDGSMHTEDPDLLSSAKRLARGTEIPSSSTRLASNKIAPGPTKMLTRIAMRSMSLSGGRGRTSDTCTWRWSWMIPSFTRSRSTISAHGCWVRPETRCGSTPARRTMRMRRTLGPAPA